MKKLTSAFLGLLLLGFMRPSVANVAEVNWLGRISLLGGAESETFKRKDAVGGSAHGLALVEGLGVIPLTPQIGLQMSGDFQLGMGAGSKFGFQGGPVYGWSGGGLGSGGKAGLFLTDQFRFYNPAAGSTSNGLRSANLIWLTPAVAFYDLIPNTNLDIWYANQLSRHTTVDGKFGDGTRDFAPTSQLRVAMNFFSGMLGGKDNTELTLGVQVNGLSGMDRGHALSGAGPVVGAAVMPWQNVEVQLLRFTMDNRNRHRVTSGVQFYFDKANPTLLQLRRKYLEPTNLPGAASTHFSGF